MILSFSHNDLDALGCQLSIHEKFGKISPISYYNTNYKNLKEIAHDIQDRIERGNEVIKLLMITDISFAQEREVLLSLKETCSSYKIPVIFVDHHMYPDNFWDSIPDDNFKVHWSQEVCGALGTYNALKLENLNLFKLIKLIDVYDMWRDESEFFEIANDLNNYFWDQGRFGLMYKFYSNDYKIPNNFLEVAKGIRADAEEHYRKLKEKNLIFKSHPDISYGYLDNHFNLTVDKELKNCEVFICASSFGALRVRFKKDSKWSEELIFQMKNSILDGETTGHLMSFSTAVDCSSKDTIMDKFKEVDLKIKTILKEKGLL